MLPDICMGAIAVVVSDIIALNFFNDRLWVQIVFCLFVLLVERLIYAALLRLYLRKKGAREKE